MNCVGKVLGRSAAVAALALLPGCDVLLKVRGRSYGTDDAHLAGIPVVGIRDAASFRVRDLEGKRVIAVLLREPAGQPSKPPTPAEEPWK